MDVNGLLEMPNTAFFVFYVVWCLIFYSDPSLLMFCEADQADLRFVLPGMFLTNLVFFAQRRFEHVRGFPLGVNDSDSQRFSDEFERHTFLLEVLIASRLLVKRLRYQGVYRSESRAFFPEIYGLTN